MQLYIFVSKRVGNIKHSENSLTPLGIPGLPATSLTIAKLYESLKLLVVSRYYERQKKYPAAKLILGKKYLALHFYRKKISVLFA